MTVMKTFFIKSKNRTSKHLKRLSSPSRTPSPLTQQIPTGHPDSVTVERYFQNYASPSLVDLVDPGDSLVSLNSKVKLLSASIWETILKYVAHNDTASLKKAMLVNRLFYKLGCTFLWSRLWIEIKKTDDNNGFKLPAKYKTLYKVPRGNRSRTEYHGLLHQDRSSQQLYVIVTNSNIRHILKHSNRPRGSNWFSCVKYVVAWTDDTFPAIEWNVLPPNMTTESIKWFVDTVIPEKCHNLIKIEIANGLNPNTQQLTHLQRRLASDPGKQGIIVDIQAALTKNTILHGPLFLSSIKILNINLRILDIKDIENATLPTTLRNARIYFMTPMPVCTAVFQELFEPIMDLRTLEISFAPGCKYAGGFNWLPKSTIELTLRGGEGCGETDAQLERDEITLPVLERLHVSGPSMGHVLAQLHTPVLEYMTVYDLQSFPNTEQNQLQRLHCEELTITNCGFDATRNLLQILDNGLIKLSWRIIDNWTGQQMTEIMQSCRTGLSKLVTLYLHFVRSFPSINKPVILDTISSNCPNLGTCCIWDHNDMQYFILTSSKHWSTHTLGQAISSQPSS